MFYVVCLLMLFTETIQFQYVPPSKEIEVVRGDSYTFGIEEDFDDPNIVGCYYKSDTGISGFFEVGVVQRKTRLETNVVSNLGDQGLCQIELKNVDSKGPRSWILIPQITVTEEELRIEKNLSEVEYKVTFYNRAPILLYTVEVLEKKAFLNYLKLPKDIVLTSCKLSFKDVQIELSVHEEDSKFILSKDDVRLKISSLGQGFCGFKMINVLREDAHGVYWILTASDKNKNLYREKFYSRVAIPIDEGLVHTRRSVIVGSNFKITCGSPHTQPFCSLFNPRGELINTKDCIYEISTVSMDDIGTWNCYSGHSGSLESIQYVVELIPSGSEEVMPWVKETKSYISIGCKVLNYRSGALYICKLTAPNKKTYNLKYGSATERYTTLGTDMNAAICAMEIKLPLLDFEKGVWKCEITGPNQRDLGGSFINVGGVLPPGYPKRIKINTELDKRFLILCEVSFSSEYCRIKAPNGTQYESTSEPQIRLGRCFLNVEYVVPSDNGTWICSFARETGIPDEQIFVDVLVADILSYYKKVEVDSGEEAQLQCSTGGLALLYCRFVSPNGISYHIQNRKTSNSISYYGRGLEYGDCGITIHHTKLSDAGHWTCITKVYRDILKSEISGQIMLEVEDVNGINAAGLGIGLAVAVILIVTILSVVTLIKRRRRHHSQIPSGAVHQRASTNSEDSDNIFNLQTLYSSNL